MVQVILARILLLRKLRPGEFVLCQRKVTHSGGEPRGATVLPGPCLPQQQPSQQPLQSHRGRACLPQSRGAGRGELFGVLGPSIKSQQTHRKGSSLSICLSPCKETAEEQVCLGCSPFTLIDLPAPLRPRVQAGAAGSQGPALPPLFTLPPPRKVTQSSFQGNDPELTFKVNVVLKVSLLRWTLKYLWLK